MRPIWPFRAVGNPASLTPRAGRGNPESWIGPGSAEKAKPYEVQLAQRTRLTERSDEPRFIKDWRRRTIRLFILVFVATLALQVVSLTSRGLYEVVDVISFALIALWVWFVWRTSRPVVEWSRDRKRQASGKKHLNENPSSVGSGCDCSQGRDLTHHEAILRGAS
jgi:hypothetical protein